MRLWLQMLSYTSTFTAILHFHFHFRLANQIAAWERYRSVLAQSSVLLECKMNKKSCLFDVALTSKSPGFHHPGRGVFLSPVGVVPVLLECMLLL